MADISLKNPLHGITLEKILTDLQAGLGWQKMGEEITIKCFTNNPNLKSSLVFLRRTPWARKKVENLYLDFLRGAVGQERQEKSKKKKEEMWPDMEL